MATEVRVNHTIKNIFWLNVSTIVCSVFPFIIRWLITRYWGMEYAGINTLFAAVLAILNISELGIGQALVIYMYKPAALKDHAKVSLLLSLYNRCYKIIGVIVGIIGIASIPFLPYLVEGECPADINIIVAYLLFLSQVVLGYAVFPYCTAAFMANQSLDLVSKFQAIGWTVVYVAQIVTICFSRNYYLYFGLLIIVPIFIGIANKYRMRKCFPEYKIKKITKTDFENNFWNSFLKKTIAMGISKLRISARTSIDTLAITVSGGLVQAAIYQNYILTMNVPMMFIGGIITGILPSLGNGMSVESKESNLAVTRLIQFAVHVIGTIFAAFLLCLYTPFMRVWMGEQGILAEKTTVMFVIYFYLRAISEINILLRNASGVWWEGKWVAVLETVVNIVLNVLLVRKHGINGVVFASIISVLVINIPLETYYVLKYCFETKPWKMLFCYTKDLLIAVVTVGITYMLLRGFRGNLIKEFVLRGIGCLLLPMLILGVLHIRDERMKGLFDIFGKKTEKNKNYK